MSSTSSQLSVEIHLRWLPQEPMLLMLRARKSIRPLRYLTILMFLFLQALYLLVIHGMAPQEAFCALEQTAR